MELLLRYLVAPSSTRESPKSELSEASFIAARGILNKLVIPLK